MLRVLIALKRKIKCIFNGSVFFNGSDKKKSHQRQNIFVAYIAKIDRYIFIIFKSPMLPQYFILWTQLNSSLKSHLAHAFALLLKPIVFLKNEFTVNKISTEHFQQFWSSSNNYCFLPLKFPLKRYVWLYSNRFCRHSQKKTVSKFRIGPSKKSLTHLVLSKFTGL